MEVPRYICKKPLQVARPILSRCILIGRVMGQSWLLSCDWPGSGPILAHCVWLAAGVGQSCASGLWQPFRSCFSSTCSSESQILLKRYPSSRLILCGCFFNFYSFSNYSVSVVIDVSNCCCLIYFDQMANFVLMLRYC